MCNNGPLLSVVIPVYNVEGLLTECVQSVLRQEFSDLEIILVNDGSTDGSGVEADDLAEGNPLVLSVHQGRNKGLSEARNRGIREASGEYILLLDSDDCLLEGALLSLAPHLRDHDVVAISGVRTWDRGQAPIRNPQGPLMDSTSGMDFLLSELRGPSPTMMAQLYVYRRQFLEENKFLFVPGLLHEDEEWTPRVLMRADSIRRCTPHLYEYRIREGSITQTRNKVANAGDIFSTVQSLRPLYENCGRDDLRDAGLAYLARLQMFAMSLASRVQLRALTKAEVGWLGAAGLDMMTSMRGAIAGASPVCYGRTARLLLRLRRVIRV